MPEKHTLAVDDRRRAVVTGVRDVCSFDENEIILRLESGEMVIGGEGLHVGRLLLEEGRLDVEGRVDSVIYQAPKMMRRLFSLRRKA